MKRDALKAERLVDYGLRLGVGAVIRQDFIIAAEAAFGHYKETGLHIFLGRVQHLG